jgi:hypothetical protein
MLSHFFAGTIAPLDGLAKLAKQYEALLLVDECHATGFLGDKGQGTQVENYSRVFEVLSFLFCRNCLAYLPILSPPH